MASFILIDQLQQKFTILFITLFSFCILSCGNSSNKNIANNFKPIQTFHSNGNMASETFMKDGIKEGVHKEWFPNGSLQVERQYKNDEMVSEKLFTLEGEVIKNIVIKDGRKYGLLYSSFCINGLVSNPNKDSLIFITPKE